MRRLFLLLLIALLPLQVFAGAADGAAAALASVQQNIAAQDGGIEAIAKVAVASLEAALADASGDPQIDEEADNNDNDVANPHAGLDELAPLPVFAFAPQVFSLAPPCSSDAACAPPFLPPAARPPRV